MEQETPSLSNMLGNEPQEAAEAQVAEAAPETPQTPEEAPSGPVRDEQGRFASKDTGDEPQAAEPTPGDNPIPDDQFKGYLTEKRKRQELEEKLAALEKQFQTLQQPKEPAAPPPSMWEDEQGWQNHFGSQVVQQASLNAKLDLSEMLTRRDNADFDDMKARFLEMAEQNPAIVQQALGDPDPWRKAYTIAKNAATMADLGATDLDTLKAKLREELLAEMGQSPVPQQQPLPPTLTGERNVGARSGPAWSGPPKLSEMLR